MTGSVSPILAAVVGVLLLLAVAVADVGLYLRGRVAVATAADAAALAAAPVTFASFGATGSARDEAARFARRNGARLLRCRCPYDPSWRPRTVTVVVTRRVSLLGLPPVDVLAVSRATFDPVAAAVGQPSP